MGLHHALGLPSRFDAYLFAAGYRCRCLNLLRHNALLLSVQIVSGRRRYRLLFQLLGLGVFT